MAWFWVIPPILAFMAVLHKLVPKHHLCIPKGKHMQSIEDQLFPSPFFSRNTSQCYIKSAGSRTSKLSCWKPNKITSFTSLAQHYLSDIWLILSMSSVSSKWSRNCNQNQVTKKPPHELDYAHNPHTNKFWTYFSITISTPKNQWKKPQTNIKEQRKRRLEPSTEWRHIIQNLHWKTVLKIQTNHPTQHNQL